MFCPISATMLHLMPEDNDTTHEVDLTTVLIRDLLVHCCDMSQRQCVCSNANVLLFYCFSYLTDFPFGSRLTERARAPVSC